MSAMKRCRNCGKRIFFDDSGGWRDANPVWKHYGYAKRECENMRLKYAEPQGGGQVER